LEHRGRFEDRWHTDIEHQQDFDQQQVYRMANLDFDQWEELGDCEQREPRTPFFPQLSQAGNDEISPRIGFAEVDSDKSRTNWKPFRDFEEPECGFGERNS
jgi:hypothetical protein